MRPGARISVRRGAVAVVAIVALTAVGSFVYWQGDGRPGTADDFRGRVATAGLDVVWSNSGPRGGNGVVDTACGPVEVIVNDQDDQLFVRWADKYGPATRGTIDALLTCARYLGGLGEHEPLHLSFPP